MPSPQLPPFAVGRGVTAVVITPQQMDANGFLTDLTVGGQFYGWWDEIDGPTSEVETEMIQAGDQFRDNEVPVGVRTTYRVVEILKLGDSVTQANTKNLLKWMAYQSGTLYFKVELASMGVYELFYGLMRSYAEVKRRGKMTGISEFVMVDPFLPNPSFQNL